MQAALSGGSATYFSGTCLGAAVARVDHRFGAIVLREGEGDVGS
jgi:hypothetical protein